MNRYEPLLISGGWLVFDSLAGEALTPMPERNSFGAATALSTLLNDLEGIGRGPGAYAAERGC